MTKLLKAVVIGFLAAIVITGCATAGDSNKETGTLTIIGIPNEFNGKFIRGDSSSGGGSGGGGIINSIFVEAKMMQVVNGEVNLPVVQGMMFKKSYLGNDTVGMRFWVGETRQVIGGVELVSPKFFLIPSVKFENGVAEVNWNRASKVGITITINNIPESLNNTQCSVFVDAPLGGFRGEIKGTYSQVSVLNPRGGSMTFNVNYEYGGNYLFSDFTGTKSIFLVFTKNGISNNKVEFGELYVDIPSVQIKDSSAIIDLRRDGISSWL